MYNQQYQQNAYAQPPIGQQAYGQPPPQYGYNQQQPFYPQNHYQAPYQNPPPPPHTTSTTEKFSKNSQYKDVWAAILFILDIVAFIVVAVIGINNLSQKSGGSSGNFRVSSSDITGISVGSIVVAFVLSAIYFWMMEQYTVALIYISFGISILMMLAFAVIGFIGGNAIGGIIALVFVGLYIWAFLSWRSRIPFAVILLRNTVDVIKKYPATIFTAIIGLVLNVGIVILWICATVGFVNTISDKSTAVQYVAIVYLLFSFYWMTQVIKNTTHVTVSGLYAAYYFLGVSTNGTVTLAVSNPTLSAAKRAVTTSFGSICFGSLIIAILQTIRALLRMAADNARDEGNVVAAFCAMCAHCILSCIEDLVEYFNEYAFAQVAVYGKDFCSAAKDTWNLVKTRGVSAIINDSLVGSILDLGALLVGLLTAGFGLLYVVFSSSLEKTTSVYVIVGLLCFFVGVTELSILTSVIRSGVITTFVCLAEDPSALQRTKPELYSKIMQVYPLHF